MVLEVSQLWSDLKGGRVRLSLRLTELPFYLLHGSSAEGDKAHQCVSVVQWNGPSEEFTAPPPCGLAETVHASGCT